MTLQNGAICGDKAYLWCDTAYFDARTGDLLTCAAKAFQGLSWPFAGVSCSIGGNPQEIAFEIGKSWPEDVPGLLSETSAALRRYAAKGYLARILLATWIDRPQLWLIATDNDTGEGAFVPCEVLHYVNSGNGLREAERAFRRGITPKRMARVIDAQIANPVPAAGPLGAAGYHVQFGGNVVEIEVSREGVGSRVLRAIS